MDADADAGLDDSIRALLTESKALLARGADRDHHDIYQQTVRTVGAWPWSTDTVQRLREMYAESEQAQRNGLTRQPTYRRALVHVLAARLSEQASHQTRRPIVVSPAQARPVLHRTDNVFAEPDDVIVEACAHYGPASRNSADEAAP